MSHRIVAGALIVLGAFMIVLIIGLLWLLLLRQPAAAVDTRLCEVEPASQWAPQGFICPPMYGEGTASQWPGPGVARNDCVYPWTSCPPITITAIDTGRSVTVTPTMWCMCWVGVTGPLGETARIVDLDPATVAALGLDPGRGLHRVQVYPAGGSAGQDPGNPLPSPSPATDGAGAEAPPQALPDTAMQP